MGLHKLKPEFSLAGLPDSSSPRYQSAPANILIPGDGVYLKKLKGRIDGALHVFGNGLADYENPLNDGETVLYEKMSRAPNIKKGDIVVIPAVKLHSDMAFHSDWKCLRVVEQECNDKNNVVVSYKGNSGEKKLDEVSRSNIVGRAHYAFS